MQLHETYRPTELSGLLGQEKAVKQVNALARRGLSGRAYWIKGRSGTGKTTLGYIIGRMIADPFNIIELDAADLTPSRIAVIEQESSSYALGVKSGRVYIVNEAHGMRKEAVTRLLTLLERIPGHVAWIFTTTTEGNDLFEDQNLDSGPLLSRCQTIALTNQGLAPKFAARAREIALQEGLDGVDGVGPYEAKAKAVKNNMRALLQAVEAGDFL